MTTLLDAIRAVGFEPPDDIPPGKITRFSTNGKHSNKAGWIYMFADNQGASFGCYRSNVQYLWQAARKKPFTNAENKEFKLKVAAAKKASIIKREEDYTLAAEKALAEWKTATPANHSHTYLQLKGITPNMARVDASGRLLIPVYGLNKEIQSLQRISSDGQKRFFSGGMMRNGHVWLGTPENGNILLLSEGFATGDTLHRATGYAICICFSANNLLNLAKIVREHYPLARLLICGDDDIKTSGNPGRTKATEAAQAVAGTAIFPVFCRHEGGDFNDLEQKEGIQAVQMQVSCMELPIIHQSFAVPALSGTDARDGTYNTRELSELGNAKRLFDAHGGNVHYVHDAKAWLYWHNGAWNWDSYGTIIRGLAAQLTQQIYSEGCLHLANSEFFSKWSRNSQKKQSIYSSVSLLEDFTQVRLSMGLVDANLFQIGLNNARTVIDLHTGVARPANQSDFVTKSVNVNQLGKSTEAVRWMRFLNQIFNDDAELIDWIKRWCGYMLTGSTSEQIFIFCFGLGANGKSVFADTLRFILSDYARAIASETLTESKKQGGSATPDLAELVGVRLAMSAETEDGAALAESLIKSLVAGDTISARKLYSAPMQLTPQFKLMVLGNHKPIIRGNDHGIWRRVRLIPFTRTFKEEERDHTLSDKLRKEAPHILAWMIEGCLDWQQRGLSPVPAAIKLSTVEYQKEQDLIGKWISDCCHVSPTNQESATLIYSSYVTWCQHNGLKPASNVALGRQLSERGFIPSRSSVARFRTGLSVINTVSITTNSAYADNYRTASGR